MRAPPRPIESHWSSLASGEQDFGLVASGAAGATSLPVGVAMALARDLPRLRGTLQPPSHGGKVRLLLP